MNLSSNPFLSSPTFSSARRERRRFSICFLLFFAALCVLGTWNAKAESKTSATFSEADKEFVLKANQGGMTEVAMGKLASEKGATSEIKDFGKMMVRDHGKINADIAALAKKKGLALPSALDEKHQAKVDKLTKLSGKDFDAAYASDMAVMHKKDFEAFTEEEAATSDPDLKAVLNKAIPVVKSHIEHLKMLSSK